MNTKELLVNIGNSRVQIAWKGKKGPKEIRILDHREYRKECTEIFKSAEKVWIASVVPALTVCTESCVLEKKRVYCIKWQDIPIKNRLRSPERTGIDRFLNIYAAFSILGAPCAVADCGSAFTIDVADADGYFAGGIIAPGPFLAEESLRTLAQLKEFIISDDSPFLGKDTSEAISSGIRYGLSFLLEGYRAELQKVYPEIQFLLTGGGAGLLRNFSDISIEPFLTLQAIFFLSCE